MCASVALGSDAAATSIQAGGTIASDTTWSVDTVKVVSDVVVDKGATLTIRKGALVEFQAHYSLQVKGRLSAQGAAGDTIRFQSKDTVAGWAGIRFSEDSALVDSSRLSLCRFRYGKATGTGISGYGGAIFANKYSKLSIARCLFFGNTAGSGGGIYLQFSHARIVNCAFVANTADFYGGGLLANYSNPAVIGSLFDRNNARTGGGIDLQNSAPQITNVLATRNSAVTGSALRCFSSSPTVRNTIIWGNHLFPAGEGQVVLHDDPSEPAFSYSLIEGGKAAFTGDGSGTSYTGTFSDNIDADPVFEDTSKSNFKLKAGSPALNKGIPDISSLDLPAVDLAGEARVAGGRIDLGPLERQDTTPIRLRPARPGAITEISRPPRIDALGRCPERWTGMGIRWF
ncbi:MAG TPA: choice-of-anchor Q domain-containing protein [Fibrobacteria bacterium]|nr:choice-of-anchor Q domain-containing protein [Fibrobacteria bacterium]